MQAHLRMFGNLVERGIKSNIIELSTDAARCDVFLESHPYSLNYIKREFRSASSIKRHFRKPRALYLEVLCEKEASAARQAEVRGRNLFYPAGVRGLGVRGGRDGRGVSQTNRSVPRRPDSDKSPQADVRNELHLGKYFRCGQSGHRKRDCTSSSDKGTAAVGLKGGCSLDSARCNKLLNHSSGEQTKTTWLIGEGATHRLTGEYSMLSRIRKLGSPITFGTATQRQVAAYIEGEVNCESPNGAMFAIRNVFQEKNGTLDILFLSTLLQRGWEVDWSSNELKGHVLIMGKLEGL